MAAFPKLDVPGDEAALPIDHLKKGAATPSPFLAPDGKRVP